MSTDLCWFKSSYSGEEGECLEVALAWTKSSHSTDEGECVEVAHTPAAIHIRDSKNPEGPTLRVTPGAWADFLAKAATT